MLTPHFSFSLQMQSSISIEPLALADIDQIPSFQPKDWSDVASRFRAHFGQLYFYPIKAVKNKEMVGIGQLIVFETSAWLGNIIVKESHQQQGIGRRITQHLMEMAKVLHREEVFLLATAQGQPLYEKLGFQTNGRHDFYNLENWTPIPPPHPAIRRAEPPHFNQILTLDEQASGEQRSALLQRYFENTWVFVAEHQTNVEGFYMPDLGEGLIIAKHAEAGIALLEFRNKPQVVIPTNHLELSSYLKNKGCQCFRNAALMYVSKNKHGQPDMIYSRIGGYAG